MERCDAASAEELGERWTLDAEDLALLSGLPDAGKFGLAAQLAYWPTDPD
jgi:hypothetical protein